MGAYVALTHRAWFDFLASREAVDEVNFWMPTPWNGRFGVLRRGEPLLFKLHAPYKMIAGGGFFEHYTNLPISLAWDAFREKNGAASLAEVRRSISPFRSDDPRSLVDFVIGCILLVEPFFWPEELWIPAPEDWASGIQRGKRYDFSTPVGSRLWSQVQERLQGTAIGPAVDVDARPRVTVPGGYGDPTLVPHRLGQGTFRVIVTDAYQRQCAVTRERALPALDAAHIRPFSEVATHHVQNGLLLRSDVHRLFDAGYITVTPEHRVEASSRMRDDFNDGENYMRLHGSEILLPANLDLQPDPVALRWHNDHCFRG
ncbi:MAG: putative restriction endonuclease [Acidobacteriota bacterium]|jgi:putative restriction endonuclease|nr:putative restriction endonuclease [Acidobacteriota bacterium]